VTMSRATTVPACLLERAARSPRATAFQRRDADRWVGETWDSVLARVRNLSGHLIRLGLLPGDRIAIMMPTSIEWEICHLAALAAGCAVVGIDAHDATDNIRHILRTVTPRGLFVARQEQVQTLAGHLAAPLLLSVINGPATEAGCHSLGDLLADAAMAVDPWPRAQAQDLATIIFTSGSTGQPKGVAYTHAQLCLACEAILERFDSVGEGTRFACWLPLSNLFQRIINLCGMIRGGESYFVENPVQIIERLPEIRPTLFIGVPRFFEKLHAGIEGNLARRPGWMRRAVNWARSVGQDYRRHERAGRQPGVLLSISHRLADSLFLSRVRTLMGPDLQFMVSGSAPLPVWLMESFHAIGWLVLEAYGTSENVVPIAINSPEAYRFGSVGRPLPQNEIHIADDGELLVRGPGVFTGYYERPIEESPLDAEGFLPTGDYARQDADGFLWLAGRKSEIFKTSTGRRVAPVPIEARLKQLPYVEYAVVFGRDRPFPVALLCVSPDQLPDPPPDGAPLAASATKKIADDLPAVCADLPSHDRPAGILVTREALNIARGELTSNLKLRRAPIEAKYRAHLDALYAELSSTHPKSSLPVREVT
jgi:long-chain acyl-CoA synthetase